MAIQLERSGLKCGGRYLIFSYATYYPSGGLSDVIASCDTLAEIQHLMNMPSDPDKGWYGFGEYVDVLDMDERRWLLDSEYAS